jgi:hypothetical protein
MLLSLGIPSSLYCLQDGYKVAIADASKSYFYKKIPGGILLQVRKVETKLGVDRVFDIEVENNANYLTSSFLVHNSAVGALTCYLLGITSVDPIKEGLLFSRFMSEARGGRSIVLEFKNIDPLPKEDLA